MEEVKGLIKKPLTDPGNSMVMTGGKGGGGVEEGEGAQMVTEGALTWGVNMQCTDHALQNYT